MVRYLLYSLILGITAACTDNVACQSPPETLRLILQTAGGANVIVTNDPDQVSIRYFQNGQSTTIRDLTIRAPAVESLDVLQIARQTGDTTRFYVSVNGRPKGFIQLKTYVDNRRCQGWTRTQELRFNGQTVAYDNMKPGYSLAIPL